MDISLYKAFSDTSMEDVAVEVLRSGAIAGGIYVEKFSRQFGELIQNPYVVTTNDMSNALQIALRLAGVTEGSEVLTTPFACMATNAPIVTVGGKPVWVDVIPTNGTMDPDKLTRAITSKCKALILYHVAGYPGYVREIKKICTDHGIVLIEDCNAALLATVDGHHVGCWGDYSIYSFYPNRQINATEGGAIVCSNAEDASRAINLRRYGIDLKKFRLPNGEIDPDCDIPEIGWAATFNNLCSAIGVVQIRSVRERINFNRLNAQYLDSVCDGLDSISAVKKLDETEPSYWLYLVRIKSSRELMKFLLKQGIRSSKLHMPNNRYSGFGVASPYLLGCAEFYADIVALPCGWWLRAEEMEYIAQALIKFEGTQCH